MALRPLFFYGTLRHLPLLERVLGRSAQAMDLVEATLPDHAVHWVAGQCFPMISKAQGGQARGLILRSLSAEDIARLNYYEGGFAYDLRDVTAVAPDGETIAAQVYFPQEGGFEKGDPWSLDAWIRDWGEVSLIAAAEAMAHYGQWSAQELAHKLPMMRRRADTMRAARLRGPSPDHRDGAERVEILSRNRVHSHFFALDRMEMRHPLYDGGMSDPLDREAFFAGQAVVVLPYDPVRDAVLLIEQFRVNVYAVGDPSPWVIEAIAGLVDPGEAAETTAMREAEEEAGLTPIRLEKISATYSSTGSSTEFVTAFLALADFSTLGDGGGVESEGEDIRRIILPFDDFAKGLETHRFRDAPLVAAGFWLINNRARLRSSA
ncbi:NUDIX domain-containing protein [Aestuariivita boseongensis]|uniref:NUDIX domain-containing protein n=1 Tax=Aestuariivita boseongensis TaxID=1470562 RepID=UPI0006805BD1|nr:NUDIX domain-containing protein [Aestuariivita boseongensis]